MAGRGRVLYRYRQPFRDGSIHVVPEPLDLIARWAAMVPGPRANLTCFHGVFAANFKHRKRMGPLRPHRTIDNDTPRAPMRDWGQIQFANLLSIHS